MRKQLADSAEAKKRLAEAQKAHEKAIAQAKAEATQVIEEARVDAERIVEQLHAQADAEVERIKVQGAQQVQLQRAQLIRQLRQDLGAESVRRAGELVVNTSRIRDAQSATVDRFLDELDAMAPSEAVIGDRVTARMRLGEPGGARGAGRDVRRGDGRPRARPVVFGGRRFGLGRQTAGARVGADAAISPTRPTTRRPN